MISGRPHVFIIIMMIDKISVMEVSFVVGLFFGVVGGDSVEFGFGVVDEDVDDFG